MSEQDLGRRDALNVLLQEWTSVRSQGDLALGGQLTALSLGIGAISVLLAAVGSIWRHDPLIACVGLMTVVPSAAYLLLLLWATEIKKTLRASSFLRMVVEPQVNRLFDKNAHLLNWELDGWQYGNLRVYYSAIGLGLLSVGCASCAVGIFQFERLRSGQPALYHGWMWSTLWAVLFGVFFALIPAVTAAVFFGREMSANRRERGERT